MTSLAIFRERDESPEIPHKTVDPVDEEIAREIANYYTRQEPSPVQETITQMAPHDLSEHRKTKSKTKKMKKIDKEGKIEKQGIDNQSFTLDDQKTTKKSSC